MNGTGTHTMKEHARAVGRKDHHASIVEWTAVEASVEWTAVEWTANGPRFKHPSGRKGHASFEECEPRDERGESEKEAKRRERLEAEREGGRR